MLWDQEAILISHTSSLHALFYTMPVKLISGALHWPSVALSTALLIYLVKQGSGSLDSLVVGVALRQCGQIQPCHNLAPAE